MKYTILNEDMLPQYWEHILANSKNSRVSDPLVIEKIKQGFMVDSRIIVFCMLDDSGAIQESVMTLKRRRSLEYIIVNYRTTGYRQLFSKSRFLDMFSFVFDHYETIGYYKWILARPIDMLGAFFTGIGTEYPFSKYETAIEYVSSIPLGNELTYGDELLSGRPNELSADSFMVISGFCKNNYRDLFKNLEQHFR